MQHSIVPLTLIHQTNLVNNHVAVVIVLWLTEFESAGFIVSSPCRFENLSEATLAKLIVMLDLEVKGRIGCLGVSVTEKHIVFEFHLT